MERRYYCGIKSFPTAPNTDPLEFLKPHIMFSPYQWEISDVRDRIEIMGKLLEMGPSSLSRIPELEGAVQLKILYNPFCRLTNPIILPCSWLNRSGYFYLHDVFKLNQSPTEHVLFAIFSQLFEMSLVRFQDFSFNSSICWIHDVRERRCIRSWGTHKFLSIHSKIVKLETRFSEYEHSCMRRVLLYSKGNVR